MFYIHATTQHYPIIRSGLAALLLLISLTACERHIIADENSALYSVPAGSLLILPQAIEIPPGSARVFIQQGQIIPSRQINQYQPYCEFEINTLKDDVQIIQPDQFHIYKVTNDIRYVSRQTLFASLSSNTFDSGDIVGFTDEFFLRSASQPDVRKLSCLHWDDAHKRMYLSIKQIRQALGNIFELRLAK